MKKILCVIYLSFFMMIVAACSDEPIPQEPVLLDVTGMTVSEARLHIDGAYRITPIEVYTNAVLPNTIISYDSPHEINDTVTKGATVQVVVALAPENSYSLSSQIAYVYEVGYLTGPSSSNYALLSSVGIQGTDLGIPVRYKDEMIILYGDSVPAAGFKPPVGNWFSNFMARSSDFTLHDGLTFDAVVTNSEGVAMPFAQGAHDANVADEHSDNPDREVTKIPTGGISIGDDFYVFYMSVRYWGLPGQWFVTYNQALKSSDNLQTFTPVESLRFEEDEAPNFGQVFIVEDPDDTEIVYLLGKPGGRTGGTVLARTLKSHFEDRDEIEYYLGNDVWMKGDAGLNALKQDPHYIISPPCSEMSVMYNAYLGKWIAVYLRNSQIVMQTADSITGPFTNTQVITNAEHYYGLYGGFAHEAYTDYNGQKFYIQISLWHPTYQVILLEVVLN